MTETVRVNRAPALALCAAAVAGRLGFERDEALTLGRASAGSVLRPARREALSPHRRPVRVHPYGTGG